METQPEINDIKTKSDDEILAELKRLSAEITNRRRRGPRKVKEQIEASEPNKRGRPKKVLEQNEQREQDEHTDESQQSDQTKPKKHFERRAGWRYGEDGKYFTKAIDPQYDAKYWREHYRKPYNCDICGTTINCCGTAVQKHKLTMRCQLAKFQKEQSEKHH